MNKKIKLSTHVIALLCMLGAMGVTSAYAQTYTPSATTAAQGTSTIGAPTTGAGGDASLNLILLASSLALIAGGSWYIGSAKKIHS